MKEKRECCMCFRAAKAIPAVFRDGKRLKDCTKRPFFCSTRCAVDFALKFVDDIEAMNVDNSGGE